MTDIMWATRGLAADLMRERDSLATQLEQMRRERDEARAKLARIREMVSVRHDIGINGLAIATLRIIDEKEGGQ